MFEDEIKEFISFMMHYKGLSKSQIKRRDALFVRDILRKPQDDAKPKEEKVPLMKDESVRSVATVHRKGVDASYISPSILQDFLIDYNQNPVLKYTCHQIDSDEVIDDINKRCGTDNYDLKKHSELINREFGKLVKSYEKRKCAASEKMIHLIWAYLNGYTTWSSNEIDINWGKGGLYEWAEKNPGIIPSPGKNIASKQHNNGYRLNEPLRSNISGKRIMTFSDIVIFFKTLFHVRQDNSLRSLLEYRNAKFKDNVEISFMQDHFKENIELFTDVDKLIQTYDKIVKFCIDFQKDKNEKPKVNLTFYEDSSHKYFEIHHVNTKYGKSLHSTIQRSVGEEYSALIKNQINGVCDLFLEADFDGEYARLNLWDEQPVIYPQIKEKLEGVKYILRF